MSKDITRLPVVQERGPDLKILQQAVSVARTEGQAAANSAAFFRIADLISSGITVGPAQRGRPRGPAGFSNKQEFLDILVELIQTAHANNIKPTETRIAEFLRPEIDSRRGTGSAARPEDPVESTVRTIRHHLPVPWPEFVQTALKSKK